MNENFYVRLQGSGFKFSIQASGDPDLAKDYFSNLYPDLEVTISVIEPVDMTGR